MMKRRSSYWFCFRRFVFGGHERRGWGGFLYSVLRGDSQSKSQGREVLQTEKKEDRLQFDVGLLRPRSSLIWENSKCVRVLYLFWLQREREARYKIHERREKNEKERKKERHTNTHTPNLCLRHKEEKKIHQRERRNNQEDNEKKRKKNYILKIKM